MLVDHLRKFGTLKRQIELTQEELQVLADRLKELNQAMEHLGYEIIKDNRDENH